ncbi:MULTISPECIES: hypothetical protein [unclassified Caballeronia]|uniref:hypothetical protein n=1 Tax=unclassified Caballeronia TaxID=2646786 RepID=UPI00286512B5|nr:MULTISPECIES: hypothetical protein [unclassified Caballeronia]MDR5739627.1 hypothetical protein [Caballeronia sp. LZ016]MDR5808094.1 hypothetical protein [Caballeronia sp. LZ019]
MRKADSKRASLKLTQHSYSLTPKRNAAYLPGVIAAVCAVGALVAAGFALKNSQDQSRKLDVLCAPPASEQKLQEQLTHAQFALEQEAATRAALEQRVAQGAAQIERLQTDLAFLKKQR